VVFVTHDLREALLLGTRIAMMEAGRLVTAQTPDDFVQSAEPIVATYVHAFEPGLKRGT
jgi:ABC-type proline/glycine betaine transport system ATPase subunit